MPAVSYEILYDLLRREKVHPELQKLDPGFLHDLHEFLKSKISTMQEQASKQSVFSAQESLATEKQLENIKRLIREFFEKRETKILTLALSSSRTKAKYDVSALLKEEEGLFESVKGALDNARTALLTSLEPRQKEPATKQVKFLNPTPQFLGRDLKQYGPFSQDEQAAIPEEIAQLLLNKNQVEEV